MRACDCIPYACRKLRFPTNLFFFLPLIKRNEERAKQNDVENKLACIRISFLSFFAQGSFCLEGDFLSGLDSMSDEMFDLSPIKGMTSFNAMNMFPSVLCA